MSKKTKEKIRLFEKAVFPDVMTAQEMYDNEEKKFRFRLICTCISLVTTLVTCPLLAMSMNGSSVLSNPVMSALGTVFFMVGAVVTIVSGPVNVIKLFLKTGKVFYFVMPIVLLDIVMFAFGLIFALFAFIFVPVVFAAYNLYQSYINRKDAAAFLALNNRIKETNTYEAY